MTAPFLPSGFSWPLFRLAQFACVPLLLCSGTIDGVGNLVKQDPADAQQESSCDGDDGSLGAGPGFEVVVFPGHRWVLLDESPRGFYEKSTHTSSSLPRDVAHPDVFAGREL